VGFWAGSMWQPVSGLVDKHWNVRPNGQAWIDLVKKRWWSDTTVVTDANGVAKVRVFKGDYEVSKDDVKRPVTVFDETEVRFKP